MEPDGTRAILRRTHGCCDLGGGRRPLGLDFEAGGRVGREKGARCTEGTHSAHRSTQQPTQPIGFIGVTTVITSVVAGSTRAPGDRRGMHRATHGHHGAEVRGILYRFA